MIIKSMVLNELSEPELTSVKEIDSLYFPFPWSDDVWDRSLADPNYLTFFDPGRNGFALFLLCPLDKLAHLVKIIVKPESRGSGIAASILNASHSHFRILGIERSILEVDTLNRAAIRLYEKHGYKIIHLNKNFYSNGADAHIMEKHL